MSTCGASQCVLWYDYQSSVWVIASDCEDGCRCPTELADDRQLGSPFRGFASPSIILSCVPVTSAPGEETAVFMPLTVTTCEEEPEPIVRRTGFGTIVWEEEWLCGKLNSNCRYIGSQLQRKTHNRPADRTNYSIGDYNTDYFPNPCEMDHGLRSEINGFVFFGIDDTPVGTPNAQFCDPKIAGTGSFVEFDFDIKAVNEMGVEKAASLIQPLFAMKSVGDEKWENVGAEEARDTKLCSEALTKIVEQALPTK